MKEEAQIAAKFRAHIKSELPDVKARVRVQYRCGYPSIIVDIDRNEFIDQVLVMAADYCDDFLFVCVNGHWVYPADEDDHSHMFVEKSRDAKATKKRSETKSEKRFVESESLNRSLLGEAEMIRPQQENSE